MLSEMREISGRKGQGLAKLVNGRGVIAAAAMDQRGVLRAAIAAARGVEPGAVPDDALTEFKTAVTRILTPHASAILLDPDFGLPAAAFRAPEAGLLLAYEADTFLNTQPHKVPNLIGGVTVRRLLKWGADGVKILVRYNPFDDPAINGAKQAVVERVGVECAQHGVPYFLEFTGYGQNENTPEYARRKPEIVRASMEEFSKPHYYADVLKVEIPINVNLVGQAYSRQEALDHFRAAAQSTRLPFIYLSAGVSHAAFLDSLDMAISAEAPFAGVLCGRATWQDGIPIYARQGAAALEDWLATAGVRNIQAINERLSRCAPVLSPAQDAHRA
jgi:tagatose 1,6-diphosphate aldolase